MFVLRKCFTSQKVLIESIPWLFAIGHNSIFLRHRRLNLENLFSLFFPSFLIKFPFSIRFSQFSFYCSDHDKNPQIGREFSVSKKSGRPHGTEVAFALPTKQSWVRIPTFFQMIFQAQWHRRKPQ